MKTITYLKPCPPDQATVVMNEKPMCKVTEQVNDRFLLDMAILAEKYEGVAWRDGDGVSPRTQYGIAHRSEVTKPNKDVTAIPVNKL